MVAPTGNFQGSAHSLTRAGDVLWGRWQASKKGQEKCRMTGTKMMCLAEQGPSHSIPTDWMHSDSNLIRFVCLFVCFCFCMQHIFAGFWSKSSPRTAVPKHGIYRPARACDVLSPLTEEKIQQVAQETGVVVPPESAKVDQKQIFEQYLYWCAYVDIYKTH